MTLSQQPPRKPAAPGKTGAFSIPARPASTPVSEQHLPAWQPVEPDEQSTEPTPPQSSQQRVFPETGASAQHPDPFQPPPARPSHLKHPSLPPVAASPARKKRGLLVALLAVLVVLGGLLGQHLLSTNGDPGGSGALNFSGAGPYARLPLSPAQINAIMHLPGHMKYKALASLYVSHMNLTDELGQLIMLEYSGTSYTSDLDYAINTLHVGGVIMYEFQMNTFAQTKGDIAHMQRRANIPLLISTDEEGGPYVRRLNNIYGNRMSPTQIFQSGDVNVAKQQGLLVSQQMAALGLNENLTPDVDTNQVNGYDMISRTFGNTPRSEERRVG